MGRGPFGHVCMYVHTHVCTRDRCACRERLRTPSWCRPKQGHGRRHAHMNTSAHRHITNTHTTHNMQHTRWASPPGLRGFQIRCNGFALTRHTHTHTHIHPRTRIHTHMHKRILSAKIGTMWVSTGSLTEYTRKSAVSTQDKAGQKKRDSVPQTHTQIIDVHVRGHVTSHR